jgi:hypothetical protein
MELIVPKSQKKENIQAKFPLVFKKSMASNVQKVITAYWNYMEVFYIKFRLNPSRNVETNTDIFHASLFSAVGACSTTFL